MVTKFVAKHLFIWTRNPLKEMESAKLKRNRRALCWVQQKIKTSAISGLSIRAAPLSTFYGYMCLHLQIETERHTQV